MQNLTLTLNLKSRMSSISIADSMNIGGPPSMSAPEQDVKSGFLLCPDYNIVKVNSEVSKWTTHPHFTTEGMDRSMP
jgi:hypothetical protein